MARGRGGGGLLDKRCPVEDMQRTLRTKVLWEKGYFAYSPCPSDIIPFLKNLKEFLLLSGLAARKPRR
jgi:hypothetical protein